MVAATSNAFWTVRIRPLIAGRGMAGARKKPGERYDPP
jgi:hypothetical protein